MLDQPNCLPRRLVASSRSAVNEEWDFEFAELPEVTSRYFKWLEIFQRVLGEEGAKTPGHEEKEVSKLVKWSVDSGAVWLHILLFSGFFDWFSFPCMQLRQRVGAGIWREQMNKINNTEEAKAFVAKKLCELEFYDQKVDKVEHCKALMESGVMTKEELIVKAQAIISDK